MKGKGRASRYLSSYFRQRLDAPRRTDGTRPVGGVERSSAGRVRHDPPEHLGIGSLLGDMITRGAGNRSSRNCRWPWTTWGWTGMRASAPCTSAFGAHPARNLPAALEIYADILRGPHFPDEEFEPVQSLALQDLQAIEDEPRQKLLIELRRRHYPAPLGQDRRGNACRDRKSLAQIDSEPLPESISTARHDPLRGGQHPVGTAARPGGALVR